MHLPQLVEDTVGQGGAVMPDLEPAIGIVVDRHLLACEFPADRVRLKQE